MIPLVVLGRRRAYHPEMSQRAEVPSPAEEGPDDHAEGGLIVAHFRVDASRRLVRSLAIGSVIMAVGSLVVSGALLAPRLDTERPIYARAAPSDAAVRGLEVTADGVPVRSGTEWWELGLGLLGLASIVGGAGVAIVGLNRVLREEHFLALRTDGAFFRAGRTRSLIRWEDVAEVRWDEGLRALSLERHDGDAWVRVERFAGIDGPELARRVAEVRRKALFGLLG